MILEIDMGNTRIKWRVRNALTTLAQGNFPSMHDFSVLECEIAPYLMQIKRVLVSSVLGVERKEEFAHWCSSYIKIAADFARSEKYCGIVQNGYEEPETLGTDRWLAVLAGFQSESKSCVVMSCGTAVTVDLVMGDGRHLGGYIAPGLCLMLSALNQNTRLIAVDANSLTMSLSPGRTTQSAVNAACAALLAGLINNAVSQLRNVGEVGDINIFITGGDAEKVLDFLPGVRLAPDLILDGLAYAFK